MVQPGVESPSAVDADGPFYGSSSPSDRGSWPRDHDDGALLRLVAAPADTHGKADHSTLPPGLANSSVGTGNATRVVIAPAARAAYPEAHEETRRQTERSYRAAFLGVTRDNAGRVVRVRY